MKISKTKLIFLCILITILFLLYSLVKLSETSFHNEDSCITTQSVPPHLQAPTEDIDQDTMTEQDTTDSEETSHVETSTSSDDTSDSSELASTDDTSIPEETPPVPSIDKGLLDADSADSDQDGTISDSEASSDISPSEQCMLEAGFGHVVLLPTGNYGVLMPHPDHRIDSQTGSDLLKAYLQSQNLEGTISGGWMNDHMYYFIAEQIRPIITEQNDW